MLKKIILLGATGSIGNSALRLLRKNKNLYHLIGVSAHNNAKLLSEIVNEFNVQNVVLSDCKNVNEYYGIHQLKVGSLELKNLAKLDCDIVISGITGLSGLYPAYEAISSGNDLAIANKEPLVAAGQIFMNKVKQTGAKILPVDSEHSAIFQCIQYNDNLDFITLTASGGPFLNYDIDSLDNVTPEMALNHPVWDMGDKISIDSATMFNKALEIIEASVLFDLTYEKIDVVIHPQSIIHGLVHYKDGSILANLGYPDMITPLSVALSWPDRVDLNLKKIKLTDIGNLTFIEPDYKKFPALKLGWEVLKNNKLSPIVLNAANEIAVKLFLENKIKFTSIFKLVSEIIDIYQPSDALTIDEVIYIDNIARLKSIDYFNRKL